MAAETAAGGSSMLLGLHGLGADMLAMRGLGVELLAVVPRAVLAAMAASTGLTVAEVPGVATGLESKLGGVHRAGAELVTRAGTGTGVGMAKGKGSPKPFELDAAAADRLDERGIALQQAEEPVAKLQLVGVTMLLLTEAPTPEALSQGKKLLLVGGVLTAGAEWGLNLPSLLPVLVGVTAKMLGIRKGLARDQSASGRDRPTFASLTAWLFRYDC